MAVTKALKELNGVSNVNVDLSSKKVEIEGENLVDEKLKEDVEDAGYDVIEIK